MHLLEVFTMAALQKYKPFRDLWNLEDEVDRLLWGITRNTEDTAAQAQWVPAVDVKEDDAAIRIHADLPGLKKDDVKISYRDGVLTFQGERKFEEEAKQDNYYRLERRHGMFARSFTLPNTVDPDKIKANVKDGVLDITIAKRPEAQAREIRVE